MKLISALTAGIVLLFILSGCAEVDTVATTTLEPGGAVEYEPPSSESPVPSSDSSSSPEEELPQGGSFVNQTTDMVFTIEGALCAPGQSVELQGALESFAYAAQGFEREQLFTDIAHFTSGAVRVVAAEHTLLGYTMEVYDESGQEPVMQYLLEPEGMFWFHSVLDQKLYLADIPILPMDQLLQHYPNAVLTSGYQEVWWLEPIGGYTYMLFSYEPLYNLRVGSTGAVDYVDGEVLYGPISWNGLEIDALLPGEPLFTDIISVGSMWRLAVYFEDAQGGQYLYTAGENGMGGDRPGLILSPLQGRVLTEEEYAEYLSPTQ